MSDNNHRIPINVPLIGKQQVGPQLNHVQTQKQLAQPCTVGLGNQVLLIDGLTKLEWGAMLIASESAYSAEECVERAAEVLAACREAQGEET